MGAAAQLGPGAEGSRQGTRVKGVPGFSRLFRREYGFALPVFMTPNHQDSAGYMVASTWSGFFWERSCVVWFPRCPARQRLPRDIAFHSAKHSFALSPGQDAEKEGRCSEAVAVVSEAVRAESTWQRVSSWCGSASVTPMRAQTPVPVWDSGTR
ncbi:unnamed protein product [Rangifer tarandus platyrhynchus]|uniref:Uncharacterized protein n=1 Tax=Rangifer tarandus platyrhynchus TaxID=3082113 RepID=A0AC59Y8B0_RANTA